MGLKDLKNLLKKRIKKRESEEEKEKESEEEKDSEKESKKNESVGVIGSFREKETQIEKKREGKGEVVSFCVEQSDENLCFIPIQ